MTAGTIAALFATMLVISATPGPSDFAVAARSMASGFTHGLVMVGGIVAADLLFIVVAVYGLSVVAGTLGDLFVGMKYLCGGYLIWLGTGPWRAGSETGHTEEKTDISRSSGFLAGPLITLGDPKAIFFYMGLLPAFLDPSSVSLADTLTVMLVATVVICGVKLGYAYLADRAGSLFRNTALRRRLDLAAGAVLVATGLFVAWQA